MRLARWALVGGWFVFVSQSHHLINGVAAVSFSGPVTFSGQYWEGAAYRTAGSASYGLDVIAFCMAS